MNASVIVLASGGIKSAVAAATVAPEHELILVHIDFGQPSAASERRALSSSFRSFRSARVVTLDLPILSQLRKLSGTQDSRGSARDAKATEEAVALATPARRGLLATLLSLGVQCAQRVGASTVVTGLSRYCDAAHLGATPVGGLAEGLPELLHAHDIGAEMNAGGKPPVRIDAPLLDLTLSQMIRLAERLGVSLDSTWTCERSLPRACGRCSPCKARDRAFSDVGRMSPVIASPVQA